MVDLYCATSEFVLACHVNSGMTRTHAPRKIFVEFTLSDAEGLRSRGT